MNEPIAYHILLKKPNSLMRSSSPPPLLCVYHSFSLNRLTSNNVRVIPIKARNRQIQISIENGPRKSKCLDSLAGFLSMILIPKSINGFVKSTTFCRFFVIVIPATARSAFFWVGEEEEKYNVIMWQTILNCGEHKDKAAELIAP